MKYKMKTICCTDFVLKRRVRAFGRQVIALKRHRPALVRHPIAFERYVFGFKRPLPRKLLKSLMETAPESLRIKEYFESDEGARARAVRLDVFSLAPHWR